MINDTEAAIQHNKCLFHSVLVTIRDEISDMIYDLEDQILLPVGLDLAALEEKFRQHV